MYSVLKCMREFVWFWVFVGSVNVLVFVVADIHVSDVTQSFPSCHFNRLQLQLTACLTVCLTVVSRVFVSGACTAQCRNTHTEEKHKSMYRFIFRMTLIH